MLSLFHLEWKRIVRNPSAWPKGKKRTWTGRTHSPVRGRKSIRKDASSSRTSSQTWTRRSNSYSSKIIPTMSKRRLTKNKHPQLKIRNGRQARCIMRIQRKSCKTHSRSHRTSVGKWPEVSWAGLGTRYSRRRSKMARMAHLLAAIGCSIKPWTARLPAQCTVRGTYGEANLPRILRKSKRNSLETVSVGAKDLTERSSTSVRIRETRKKRASKSLP